MTGLDPIELARYGRHLVLPEVGMEGQRRLKASRVLLVGAGGLGSPAGLYLAAAGVGTLGIVEFDRVERSNLQRQVLYGEGDVGRPKLEAARERLADVNPHVELVSHPERFSAANARALVAAYDLVVDGSDNFATRYLVNDACVLEGRYDVWGAVLRFEGQLSVFGGAPGTGRGPCYRCLFPEPPPPGAVPSCEEGGVLGVLPGVIGTLQATEAIKLLLGIGAPAIGRLLLFDALALRFREIALAADPECPLCSARPTQRGLIEYTELCGPAGPGVGNAMANEPGPPETGDTVTVAELASRRAAGEKIAVLDVRNPHEHSIAHLEGARLIPLHELPQRLGELDPAAELVVHCHVGGRSAQAVAFLRGQGFARARNLVGGIDAWSREVDPGVPRY